MKIGDKIWAVSNDKSDPWTSMEITTKSGRVMRLLFSGDAGEQSVQIIDIEESVVKNG